MSSGLRLLAVVACLGLAGLSAPAAADRAEIDYAFMPVPRGEDVRPMPKYRFGFGDPARWPGPLRWRYNGAGAPSPFADPEVAVAHLRRAFDGWGASAASPTSTRARRRRLRIGGRSSTAASVPTTRTWSGGARSSGQTTGVTYTWYTPGADLADLVDADVILSPTMVTNASSMERTARHEWGHALGLAHSDRDGVLMSGPPETAYNNLADARATTTGGAADASTGPRRPGRTVTRARSHRRWISGSCRSASCPPPREVALRNDGNGRAVDRRARDRLARSRGERRVRAGDSACVRVKLRDAACGGRHPERREDDFAQPRNERRTLPGGGPLRGFGEPWAGGGRPGRVFPRGIRALLRHCAAQRDRNPRRRLIARMVTDREDDARVGDAPRRELAGLSLLLHALRPEELALLHGLPRRVRRREGATPTGASRARSSTWRCRTRRARARPARSPSIACTTTVRAEHPTIASPPMPRSARAMLAQGWQRGRRGPGRHDVRALRGALRPRASARTREP